MKNTTFVSETSILITLPDDEIQFFDDVTKIIVRGSTLYIHRSHFLPDFDDVVKIENAINYAQYRR